jgi:four helix bundle protein
LVVTPLAVMSAAGGSSEASGDPSSRSYVVFAGLDVFVDDRGTRRPVIGGAEDEVYWVAEVVERRDGDLARQVRRASSSVVLNLSEGSYSRKGNRRARWCDAMASANETRAALQLAEAVGLSRVSAPLLDRLDKIVATLWKLTR